MCNEKNNSLVDINKIGKIQKRSFSLKPAHAGHLHKMLIMTPKQSPPSTENVGLLKYFFQNA